MESHNYIFVHRIDKQTPLDYHIPLHMTTFHWFEAAAPPKEMTSRLLT